MTDRCDGCGLAVEGGRTGCREIFDQVIARDFSDARYFSVHRLVVDCYSLQHPDQFCRSAKSLAAHLVGLCSILESKASAAAGSPLLRDWLDGRRELDKPELPAERGEITIGDLPLDAAPGEWKHAVHAWAAAIWRAYEELQPLAREWLRCAAERSSHNR